SRVVGQRISVTRRRASAKDPLEIFSRGLIVATTRRTQHLRPPAAAFYRTLPRRPERLSGLVDDSPHETRRDRETLAGIVDPVENHARRDGAARAQSPGRRSIGGGSYARIGGNGPVQRSTSTSVACPEHAWASFDVPRSNVSTLGLPWTHIASGSAGSSGSYQAPVESCTTRGRIVSVTTAPARQLPRSLNTRTTSPVSMPRAAASSGWMRIGSRPRTFDDWLKPPTSSWLCRRVVGLFATRCKG